MKHCFAALVISAFAITGCSVTASTTDVSSSPLAGKIAGQSWAFAAGDTDGFQSNGQTDFFTNMYASAFTACNLSSAPTGPHLIVSVPKQVGDYDLSLALNMTFVNGNDNKIGVDGRIIVETVTATSVAGRIHAIYDSNNEVNGRFQVTVCPAE